jgi:hypothetical protein
MAAKTATPAARQTATIRQAAEGNLSVRPKFNPRRSIRQEGVAVLEELQIAVSPS